MKQPQFEVKNRKDIDAVQREFNKDGKFFNQHIKTIILVINGIKIEACIGCRTIPEQYYARCLPYGVYMSQNSWNLLG